MSILIEPSIKLFLSGCRKAFHCHLVKQIVPRLRHKTLTEIEHDWGRQMLLKYYHRDSRYHWTTILGEYLVRDMLLARSIPVMRPSRKKDDSMVIQPDWETDKYVYEVKTRNYSSSGTMGEKVLGVPLKYVNVPTIYNKPLRIILIGYQEEEYRNILFNPTKISLARQKLLKVYQEMGISFYPGSKLVSQ